MDTQEIFIKKAKEIHGDKYDYSKTKYINSKTKICIICPEHGEFWQTPNIHLRGSGCPICANEKRGKKDTLEEFIEKAKSVHGNKYDYTKVIYKNANTLIGISCPIHGEYKQLPSAHLTGQGCPKCANRGLSLKEIIEEFRKVHGDKYDYSKAIRGKMNDKWEFICPIHGSFFQSPSKHLQGRGCPKCGIIERGKKQTSNKEEFIERSKIIYGDKYDYSKVNYTQMKDKVEIMCPKHGAFFQRPYDHLQGHGCPVCGKLMSKPEEELCSFIKEHIDEDVVRNERNILNGKEIDIFIPSLNLGIEYDGLLWHSEIKGKDRSYHLNKTLIAKERGIRLIHIFEDEYNKNRDIVLNKILHMIDKENKSNLPKIMARKCIVRQIEKNEAKNFLNRNHIQGYGKCTVSLGCFFNEKLIGVMSFLEERENYWNLVRFATNYDYICQGVGGKIFSVFLKLYFPKEIKTFADRRWTTNEEDNLYIKLGFYEDKVLKPDYRYVEIKNPSTRIHKFNFRKNAINNRYGLPLTMTESEMTNQLGFTKIWDCGLIRYIWKNNEQ